MMVPRGIDHLVIAVDDLEAARTTFTRLGFTVTPRARHPFGTENMVVQFADRSYLELLAVADPSRIAETTPEAFSFAAFNRDFLADGEGLSMLVLKTGDADADVTAFRKAGLASWPSSRFERMARGPDGSERPLAFSMAPTAEPRLPRAGFFTCRHHHPENFWHRTYQDHPNGATKLAAAVMVAPDPTDYHEFLTHFTGQHDIRSDSLGNWFDLDGSRLEVLSPAACRAFVGVDPAAFSGRFCAFRVGVADPAAVRARVAAHDIAHREIAGALVVPPEAAHGVAIAFDDASSAPAV